MAHTKTQFVIWLAFASLVLCVTVGCKKGPQNAGLKAQDSPAYDIKGQQGQTTEDTGKKTPPAEPVTVKAAVDSKPTISDIIAQRKTWGPAYKSWVGKESPDFTVTDINGQKHTLSEYRGKNVMLTFWATWCPPCIAEIPHLIELRKTTGEDKLAILAISSIDWKNTTETVRKFVAANPVINYTVTSTDISTMPRPYNLVNGIPCSFFIDPAGKIKLATEGMIPFPQMKAIIEAEQ